LALGQPPQLAEKKEEPKKTMKTKREMAKFEIDIAPSSTGPALSAKGHERLEVIRVAAP
jgi:hypothetical protein